MEVRIPFVGVSDHRHQVIAELGLKPLDGPSFPALKGFMPCRISIQFLQWGWVRRHDGQKALLVSPDLSRLSVLQSRCRGVRQFVVERGQFVQPNAVDQFRTRGGFDMQRSFRVASRFREHPPDVPAFGVLLPGVGLYVHKLKPHNEIVRYRDCRRNSPTEIIAAGAVK